MSSQKISVIIPVLNEENAIAKVIADIPRTVQTPDKREPAMVQEIIVVDNGCTDNTAAIAKCNGARIVTEPRRGYGYACLAGIAALETKPPDIVVFLDGDYSDYPTDMPQLLHPILNGETAFVIGTRTQGTSKEALLPPGPLRQLARLFLDPAPLRSSLHRLRSLPSHPIPGPTRLEHARQDLRVDSRDAAENRETGHPSV